jgi:CheY-like chemotaxis protein
MAMENKKILIVEDEGVIALQLKFDLEHMGHTVTGIYASGQEALESMETTRPDLLLIDIRLQGEMDGIEMASRINKQYDIPIIYITAHSDENTIKRAKMTEPYGYSLKPINPKELRVAVEMTLHKSQIDRGKASLTQELHNKLEQVKRLGGMLTICSSCKKIRDDKGSWNVLESYITKHSEAFFSHGICPECFGKAINEAEELNK